MAWTIVFTDVQGNELFALKNKHFTIHKSFHAEGPNGKDLFVVKGEFSRQCLCSKVAITKLLSPVSDVRQYSPQSPPFISRMHPMATR